MCVKTLEQAESKKRKKKRRRRARRRLVQNNDCEGNLGETDLRKGKQRRDDSLAIMGKQREGGIF